MTDDDRKAMEAGWSAYREGRTKFVQNRYGAFNAGVAFARSLPPTEAQVETAAAAIAKTHAEANGYPFPPSSLDALMPEAANSYRRHARAALSAALSVEGEPDRDDSETGREGLPDV